MPVIGAEKCGVRESMGSESRDTMGAWSKYFLAAGFAVFGASVFDQALGLIVNGPLLRLVLTAMVGAISLGLLVHLLFPTAPTTRKVATGALALVSLLLTSILGAGDAAGVAKAVLGFMAAFGALFIRIQLRSMRPQALFVAALAIMPLIVGSLASQTLVVVVIRRMAGLSFSALVLSVSFVLARRFMGKVTDGQTE